MAFRVPFYPNALRRRLALKADAWEAATVDPDLPLQEHAAPIQRTQAPIRALVDAASDVALIFSEAPPSRVALQRRSCAPSSRACRRPLQETCQPDRRLAVRRSQCPLSDQCGGSETSLKTP